MFYAKSYISNATCYLSLCSGFLPCSLRPFRLLASSSSHSTILMDDGTRDKTASHFTRPTYYYDVTDSRKARFIIQKSGIKETLMERGFLPDLKVEVSTSSKL